MISKRVRTDAGARRSLRSAIKSLEQAEHSLMLLRDGDQGKSLLVALRAVRLLAQGFPPVDDFWLDDYREESCQNFVGAAHSVLSCFDACTAQAAREAEDRELAAELERADPWESACAPNATWDALDTVQEILSGVAV